MFKVIGLFRNEYEFSTKEEAIKKCDELIVHYAKGGIKAMYVEVDEHTFKLKA